MILRCLGLWHLIGAAPSLHRENTKVYLVLGVSDALGWMRLDDRGDTSVYGENEICIDYNKIPREDCLIRSD